MRLRLTHRLLERRVIGGQRLRDVDVVAKGHDRTAVSSAKRLQKARGRLVHDIHLVRHARAGVDEDDEIDRDFGRFEELHVLKHAILIDRKIILRQSRHEPLAIGHGDIERDQAGTGPEHCSL